MSRKKTHPLKSISIILILICLVSYIGITFLHTISKPTNQHTSPIIPSPTRKPSFGRYTAPKIPQKPYYKIALFGDSMTYALGIHGGKLSEQLNTLYKSTPGHQHIVIDNYAIGSKNILYLKTELTTSKTDSGETLNPVTSTHPDLILIESFGYNPLSQLGISNGLKKQTETLSDTMNFITAKLPHTAVMFVATIAPNKETYAENEQPGSSITDREQQAQERTQYIQNHIAYANAHNIPLIDIYDKSLTSDGDGNPIYIEPSDHIHPSFEGIDFISNEIANNIYASQILPK